MFAVLSFDQFSQLYSTTFTRGYDTREENTELNENRIMFTIQERYWGWSAHHILMTRAKYMSIAYVQFGTNDLSPSSPNYAWVTQNMTQTGAMVPVATQQRNEKKRITQILVRSTHSFNAAGTKRYVPDYFL